MPKSPRQPEQDPPEDQSLEGQAPEGHPKGGRTRPIGGGRLPAGSVTRPVRAGAHREQGETPNAPPRTLAGDRFEVVRLLGEGGMGQVFRVRDRQIEGREVALKVLHPQFSRNAEFRKLFFQEIRAAEKFVSEHVVQVRDTGQMPGGELFLTMDLVEGVNLAELLQREESLHPRHALEITRQLLLGLQAGHEKGFVHRDVKPSNVMLQARTPKTEDNPFGVHVQILDFGLAHMAADSEAGDTAGTPFYMSPEQAQGERLDARSDLFAVGVVLYEMVAGARPFAGRTLREITQSVLETDLGPMIADLTHVGDAIRSILERALQKDREKRYSSAAEFLKAVEGSKAYRPARGAPRWMAGALAVCFLAAAAEGYLLLQRQQVESEGQVESQRQLNLLRGELAGKDAELTLLRAELREDAGTIAERDDEIVRLQGLLKDFEAAKRTAEELAEESSTSADRDYRKLEKELEQLRSEQAADREQHAADRERLAAYRKENEQLSEQLRQAKSWQYQAAHAYDRILDFVERGMGSQARATLDRAVSEAGGGMLDPAAPHGGSFLDHVVASAEALREFQEGGAGASAATLRAARESLGAARASYAVFEAESSDWIDEPTSASSDAPRLSSAAKLLDLLETRIAGFEQESAQDHEAAAQALLAEVRADGGLELVFEHARLFSCAHVDAALETVAAELKRGLLPAGKLSFAALERAKHLEDWGRALLSGELSADTAAAREIVRLHWARRWYVERSLPEPGQRWSRRELLPPPRLAADLGAWHDLLSIQLALAVLECPPTHRPEGRAVFRREIAKSGAITWQRETLLEPTAEEDLWRVERIIPASATSAQVRRTIEIRGKDHRFRDLTGSIDLCDANRDGSLELRIWAGGSADEPGTTQWSELGLNREELRGFRQTVAAAPIPCLVYRSEGVERWISLPYGLVREHRAGLYSLDLASSNAATVE